MALSAVEKFSVDADVIGFRIGLGAEFGDDGSVDLNVSSRNELLGLSAGSKSGSGDNFFHAFTRHKLWASSASVLGLGLIVPRGLGLGL